MKGSFNTRAIDGNKGWEVEEITVNNKSLSVKQILFTQYFAIIVR